jgi:hypothetical protein
MGDESAHASHGIAQYRGIFHEDCAPTKHTSGLCSDIHPQ